MRRYRKEVHITESQVYRSVERRKVIYLVQNLFIIQGG